jgi:Tol biopolymer transport system component
LLQIAAAAVAVAAFGGCGSSDKKKSSEGAAQVNGLIALRVHTGVVNWQIFTVAPSGGGLRQLTHLPAHESADGPQDPAWAPDGSALAFDAGNAQGQSIFTVQSDGRGLMRVRGLGKFVYEPSYSPDGKQISYGRDGGPAGRYRQGLFVAGVDGGRPRRVTMSALPTQGGDFASRWSPDGTRLAFMRDIGHDKTAVFVVGVDGRGLKQITPYRLHALSPDWSPDGKQIVFTTHVPEGKRFTANLFTVHPDGTGVRALTHYTTSSGGFAYHASWSPDGTRIVFSKTERFDSAGQAWTIKPDGTDEQLVTKGPASGVLTPEWGTAGPARGA